MSLLVRCRWSPSALPIEGRAQQWASLVLGPQAKKLTGQNWFRLAGSKRAALNRPVLAEDLPNLITKLARLRDACGFLHVSVWNGENAKASCGVSLTLNFDGEQDFTVFSLPDPTHLQAKGLAWSDVVELARALADGLHGEAIVTSSELLQLGLPTRTEPAFARLSPGAVTRLSCRSWEELKSQPLQSWAELFDDTGKR